MKARELIVAPRLPPPPKERGMNPFAAVRDIVADCDVPGCGWHAMGPAELVKKAIDEHNRVYHTSAEQTGIILINRPRQ